jgi:hypothetical protein
MTGEFAAATVAVIFVSNAGSVRWFLDRYRTVADDAAGGLDLLADPGSRGFQSRLPGGDAGRPRSPPARGDADRPVVDGSPVGRFMPGKPPAGVR